MSSSFPSVELLGCLIVMAAFSAAGRPWKRAGIAAASAFLWLLSLFVLSQWAAERFVGGPFTLLVDASLVVDLVRFAYAALSFPAATALVAGAAAAVLLAYFAWFALLTGAGALLRGRLRIGLFAGAVAALALWARVDTNSAGAPFWRFFHELAATQRLARNLREGIEAYGSRGAILELARLRRDRAFPPLKGLAGRDIHLFLVESYGETAVTADGAGARGRAMLGGFEAALTRRGFGIASALLESPVFGNRSWMAAASLSCGVAVSNTVEYETLLRSGMECLPKILSRSGYRTVSIRPGNTGSWPHSFFGFQRDYSFPDLRYRGPAFGWSPAADQYSVAYAAERELRVPRPPVFAEYFLTTSHFPFSDVPAFLEDWSLLGDGSVLGSTPGLAFPENTVARLGRGREGYLAALEYEFRVIDGYLGRYADRRSIAIVVGDHAPMIPVSPDAGSRFVPIHAISADPAALEPFLRRGWRRGAVPEAGDRRGTFEGFLPAFVEDHSAAKAATKG